MVTNPVENTMLITHPSEFYKEKKKLQCIETVRLLNDYLSVAAL